jgi:ribose 5-phosphate isomerase B
MKIALGTDHAGYEYKERIKEYLREKGHEVKDFGTFSTEACDYPDFIYPAAQAVGKGECDRAIVMGGSGNGETIVANKVRGVRCAVCWNEELARLCRAHNDANVMSIGARTVSIEMALKMIDVWLETPFDGGRHTDRVRKIAEIDKCSL